MKCPKCGYVGFEPSDRCRHCGYDFSLVAPAAVAEPAVAAPRAEAVPFPVVARERLAAVPMPVSDADADGAPLADLPLMPPVGPPSLFEEPPPPARTPLAVRRTTDRPRSRTTTQVFRRPRPVLVEPSGTTDDSVEGPAVASDTNDAAPALLRVAAAAIDGVVLAAIDAAVLYLTTQMAGVPQADVLTLPIVPLATFLLGLNFAYLAVFTANGGQTMGKMALGLRVEGTERPLTFGDAVVRVIVAVVGGLALGAGFLPAFWRADRRALHDQVAHTRVVRVSA